MWAKSNNILEDALLKCCPLYHQRITTWPFENQQCTDTILGNALLPKPPISRPCLLSSRLLNKITLSFPVYELHSLESLCTGHAQTSTIKVIWNDTPQWHIAKSSGALLFGMISCSTDTYVHSACSKVAHNCPCRMPTRDKKASNKLPGCTCLPSAPLTLLPRTSYLLGSFQNWCPQIPGRHRTWSGGGFLPELLHFVFSFQEELKESF